MSQFPKANWRSNNRRRTERRCIRRQNVILHGMETVCPEVFLSDEVLALLFGSFQQAQRALQRAQYRQHVISADERFAWDSPFEDDRELPALPRPRPFLSYLSRSRVFPPLVPAEIETAGGTMAEVLAILRRDYRGFPSHILLDALATRSGLSWPCCAEILIANDLIASPIEPEDVEAIRDARLFWTLYYRARARYSCLLRAAIIEPFRGIWGYFERAQLERLLPGVIIPTKLRRHDYLTNYVVNTDDSSLDVYARSNMSPLFQHRFLNKFNPLVFGKPQHAQTFRRRRNSKNESNH